MPLPEILAPAGTPPFLADGHGIAPRPVYVDVGMRTGHARRRRMTTTAPRVVSVSWFLTEAEMTAVDEWFETALLVGSRKFTALVQNQGEGALYWEAQWLTPWVADPSREFAWVVSGQLLLTGEGSETAPEMTSLGLEISVPAMGSAAITVGTTLAMEVTVPLLQPIYLGIEISVALLSSSADRRVTSVGDVRVTSTGDRRVVNV